MKRTNLVNLINSSLGIFETSLDYYHVIKKMGEGSYAKVYLAKSIICNLPVAIKCFDKLNMKKENNFH